MQKVCVEETSSVMSSEQCRRLSTVRPCELCFGRGSPFCLEQRPLRNSAQKPVGCLWRRPFLRLGRFCFQHLGSLSLPRSGIECPCLALRMLSRDQDQPVLCALSLYGTASGCTDLATRFCGSKTAYAVAKERILDGPSKFIGY